MKLLALVVLGLLSVAPSGHGAELNAASGLPLDVAAFKERRDLCDHFRGEEPYDEERKRFLEESEKKYCTGTDKELASLKTKYKNHTLVLIVLSEYEASIEGDN